MALHTPETMLQLYCILTNISELLLALTNYFYFNLILLKMLEHIFSFAKILIHFNSLKKIKYLEEICKY